jgi:hypothetical protein
MPQFPNVEDTFQPGRVGVNAIAQFAATKGMIWRENIIKDLGIDGQIEYVTPQGQATGRLVAVQVKSGPSYFVHDHHNCWRFYPEQKHLLYWERFPMPVILALHDQSTGQLAWADVRQDLRRPNRAHKGVDVPKASDLMIDAREAVFETAGVSAEEFEDDLEEVLMFMCRKVASDTTLPVTYMELFSQGLTNIVRSVYFGMDLAVTIAEMNLSRRDSEIGIGIGYAEDEFLFDYVKFLVSQDLASVDFSDCLIDWHDRKMHPSFVAPLTSRGKQLVQLVCFHEDRLRGSGLLVSPQGLHVAQDRFFQLQVTPADACRFELSSSFADLVRNGK